MENKRRLLQECGEERKVNKYFKMTKNKLLQAIAELIKEEKVKKKKFPFRISKEKRLQYYSGWSQKGKAIQGGKLERTKKLNEFVT